MDIAGRRIVTDIVQVARDREAEAREIIAAALQPVPIETGESES